MLANGIVAAHKSSEELPELLGTQVAETKAFITASNFPGRKEEDYLKLSLLQSTGKGFPNTQMNSKQILPGPLETHGNFVIPLSRACLRKRVIS